MIMPIGILVNSAAIALGGIAGAVGGKLLTREFKASLQMIFAGCAMCMGVYMVGKMENMTPFVFAMVVGTGIGLALHIGQIVECAAVKIQREMQVLLKTGDRGENSNSAALVTILIIFCASGTGIYGSIISGMTGDHSILISKSVLDFFTAIIFAADLGAVISLVALPQATVFLAIFCMAGAIFPLCTPYMISDFKAVGGFIMFTSGFRMLKLQMFPTADMLPAMVLIMPCSWLWVNILLPLLS